MKGRIALFVIVILACQFYPSYLARTSADETGIASVYSVESGRRTASGREWNHEALTAAHRTLPLGTKVKVTNKSNGNSVVVIINDRGPFVRGRIIDVSPGAARVLGTNARYSQRRIGPHTSSAPPVSRPECAASAHRERSGLSRHWRRDRGGRCEIRQGFLQTMHGPGRE
jgi:rare lipoprotein A (peptidoglycan hydrolase)